MTLTLDPGINLDGCTPSLRQFFDWANAHLPDLYVSSTKRWGTTSYHDIGQAIDISIADQGVYDRAIAALAPHISTFAEGIHQGQVGHASFSIKNGKPVPSEFWGQPTWDQHLNHIHVAVPNAGNWTPNPTGEAGAMQPTNKWPQTVAELHVVSWIWEHWGRFPALSEVNLGVWVWYANGEVGARDVKNSIANDPKAVAYRAQVTNVYNLVHDSVGENSGIWALVRQTSTDVAAIKAKVLAVAAVAKRKAAAAKRVKPAAKRPVKKAARRR